MQDLNGREKAGRGVAIGTDVGKGIPVGATVGAWMGISTGSGIKVEQGMEFLAIFERLVEIRF